MTDTPMHRKEPSLSATLAYYRAMQHDPHNSLNDRRLWQILADEIEGRLNSVQGELFTDEEWQQSGT